MYVWHYLRTKGQTELFILSPSLTVLTLLDKLRNVLACFVWQKVRTVKKEKVKSINWVLCVFRQLHKDRGEDGWEETSLSLSLILSVALSIRVSMVTRREGGTGGGVAMGTDSVCVCASVYTRVSKQACWVCVLPCSTRVCAVRVASWSFRYFSGRSLPIACGYENKRQAEKRRNTVKWEADRHKKNKTIIIYYKQNEK